MTYKSTDREQTPEETLQQRLAVVTQVAKEMRTIIQDLNLSIGVMKELISRTVNDSNLSGDEKDTLQHVVDKIAPNGVMAIQDEIYSIDSRLRSLLVVWFSDEGMELIKQIYGNSVKYDPNTINEQRGVAGSTGELRNLTLKERNNANSNRPNIPTQGTAEQSKLQSSSSAKHSNNARHYKLQSSTELYSKYLNRCPLLRTLTNAGTGPVYSWAQTCGYNSDTCESLQETNPKAFEESFGKGVNALLWPTSSGINTVQRVELYAHPNSAEGKVFILTMDRVVNEVVKEHLPNIGAIWTSPKYPNSLMVEVADEKNLSKRNPLDALDGDRECWNIIKQYLAEENPNHVHKPTPNLTRSRRISHSNPSQYLATA